MHFIGSLLKDHGKTRPDSHAFSNHVCMLRPESRGYIALKSLDPHIQPIIQPNYFSTQKDRDTLIKGVKMSREIMNQPDFDHFRGKEINPGIHIQTDQEIEEFIRNHGETSADSKDFKELGNTFVFNYRMGEIEAAIGIQLLKKLVLKMKVF